MRNGRRWQFVGAGAATLWLLAFVLVDVIADPSTAIFVALFPVAVLIACAVLPPLATTGFAVVAVAAAASAGWWNHSWATEPGTQVVRVIEAVLVGGAAVVIAVLRTRGERRHERMEAIAQIAQQAVLPTLPAVVDSVAVASRYVSANKDALVGGDLYDFLHDETTTRFVIGDVRGKGLAGVEQAARVIRAFRQFASSGADLPEVAKAISTYLMPFFDDEEFVTALLIDVTDPATIVTVSCGHPPPLLISTDGTASLVEVVPGAPLGIGEGYQATTTAWGPGDRLLLYTDGLSEARDQLGEFLSPLVLVDQITGRDLGEALDAILTAVRRHVPREYLSDDLAVVLLENLGNGSDVVASRSPACSVDRTPRNGQRGYSPPPSTH